MTCYSHYSPLNAVHFSISNYKQCCCWLCVNPLGALEAQTMLSTYIQIASNCVQCSRRRAAEMYYVTFYRQQLSLKVYLSLLLLHVLICWFCYFCLFVWLYSYLLLCCWHCWPSNFTSSTFGALVIGLSVLLSLKEGRLKLGQCVECVWILNKNNLVMF